MQINIRLFHLKETELILLYIWEIDKKTGKEGISFTAYFKRTGERKDQMKSFDMTVWFRKGSRKFTGLLAAILAISVLVSLVLIPASASEKPKKATGSTDIPNKYNVPFSIDDDEVLILGVNYKPFENTTASNHENADRFFEEVMGKKLRQAFPDVRIKYVTWDFPLRYEDLDAAGICPDIILENPRSGMERDLRSRGWVGDITEMLGQKDLDLSKLNKAAVEQLKAHSSGGIYGVPIFIDDYYLFYNKKIFDMRHVPYPKSGMTYEQAYLKAKMLTFQHGLDGYKGYQQHPDHYLNLNQFGLNPFLPTNSENPAPEDVKVNITSLQWVLLARNMDRFLTIKRNTFTTPNDFLKADMSKPGHVAMAVDTLSKLPMYVNSELYIKDGEEERYQEWTKNIDVGISSVPVLTPGCRTTYQPNQIAAFVPPQSRNLDTAYDIVKWMVSEEAQVELSRHGMKGVLETNTVKSNFGKDIPELANVDTSAIYWGDNAVIKNYKNIKFWNIPLWNVFRLHVLKDGMTPESSLIVTEKEDIPNYIKNQAAAGKDW